MQAELDVLRATKLAEFGPTLRDRQIFYAAMFGEPVERIARQLGLSVRTVKNVVDVVRARSARDLAVWKRMTLDELLEEDERLRRLAWAAQEGWNAPVTSTTRTETDRGTTERTTTRPGQVRLRAFAAAERIGVALDGLNLYIERRMAEEEARGGGAICSTGLPPPVERQEVAVVSWWRRVRRRKSLSGRRLRLPLFVRARSVRRSACDGFLVVRPGVTSKTWVHRIGIPPPDGCERLISERNAEVLQHRRLGVCPWHGLTDAAMICRNQSHFSRPSSSGTLFPPLRRDFGVTGAGLITYPICGVALLDGRGSDIPKSRWFPASVKQWHFTQGQTVISPGYRRC